MAGRARLIAALALAVLLAHAAVLALLWQQLRQTLQPRLLQPMAVPLFTRMLRPAPPAAPAAPQPLAHGAPAPRAAPLQAETSKPVSATPTQTPDLPTAQATSPTVPAPEPASAPANAPSPPVAAAATSLSPAPAQPASATPVTPATLPEPALDTWPADTRLSYQLSGRFRGDLHGSAQVQWQRRAGRYEVRVDIGIGLLASVRMTSQGLATPQGLQPRAYEEEQRGKTRGVLLGESAITFADGQAAPRPEGVQDTASQFVELAHRFATGQNALEVGQAVRFWMSRPGAVDLWTYDVVETETLHLPRLGAVQAWHLKPRPLAQPRGNITAEMWFAPSLQYLPVRIRINMGEAVFVDLLADKIEQR